MFYLSLALSSHELMQKQGREIAKEKRPATGESPIKVLLDGTVF
jgi:hypothetical protein